MGDKVLRKVAGCGHTDAYRTGCRQIAAWRRRWALPKCRCCGRLIDGEMRKGFCVWCAVTNDGARLTIFNEEKAERMKRKERQRVYYARKRAKRNAAKAAKEVE